MASFAGRIEDHHHAFFSPPSMYPSAAATTSSSGPSLPQEYLFQMAHQPQMMMRNDGGGDRVYTSMLWAVFGGKKFLALLIIYVLPCHQITTTLGLLRFGSLIENAIPPLLIEDLLSSRFQKLREFEVTKECKLIEQIVMMCRLLVELQSYNAS
ncbi:PREDICTED: uncharacterized protein LOC101301318 [Fragaria vesca subsp. vesca]